eukprot:NODE_4024_length_614_cov_287.477876_g2895_i0.p1 GENE.NODE_4024_length_614_cov_287.477876_g2895_i0~~NODE_4024_length_614_cov_287.477876_g2895_i0.p1  ORF type:complete len:137 (-),score=36.29 NODE_4024_length_614_cov_287.477876_g2895_i0:98-508(-)
MDEALKTPLRLGGSAFIMCLAITCTILGSALYDDWLPMTCLIPLAVSVVPFLLWSQPSQQDFMAMDDSGQSLFQLLAQALTTVFAVSSPALLLTMIHNSMIVWQAGLWVVGGYALLGLSTGLMLRHFATSADDMIV